jgi:hypothetical protein
MFKFNIRVMWYKWLYRNKHITIIVTFDNEISTSLAYLALKKFIDLPIFEMLEKTAMIKSTTISR